VVGIALIRLSHIPDLGDFKAVNDLSALSRTSASDCRTIAIYECTALKKKSPTLTGNAC
jgi:hypothetical protein